ncbi:TPA: hypothetical protein ACX6SN_003788 [Photobacterium damselae]|uniref:hypothetical protein n=1 Tax=Photobacterium damselae TaxID=38293 RepID=UPI00311AE69C
MIGILNNIRNINWRKVKYYFFKTLEAFFKTVSVVSLLIFAISRTKNGGAVIIILFVVVCSLFRKVTG